jgi:hypothetical protein
MTRCNPPRRAHETWKALKQLCLSHWIFAPLPSSPHTCRNKILSERLAIYRRTTSASAAHATHYATYCTPCRPLIRAFAGSVQTSHSKLVNGCETSPSPSCRCPPLHTPPHPSTPLHTPPHPSTPLHTPPHIWRDTHLTMELSV